MNSRSNRSKYNDQYNKQRFNITNLFQRFVMLGILVATIIIFACSSPYFLTLNNLYAIGLTISVIGIICIGQTLCILIRGFDLSVGYSAAFSGMLVAYVVAKLNVPYIPALFIGLAAGALIGTVNGLLITKGKINAFITTLATGFMLGGVVFIISNGYAIIINQASYVFLGTTHVYGIPLPMIIMLFLYITFHVVLRHTLFGRHLYCVGGNPDAARIAGINVERKTILTYVISGSLAAFGGIILTSRMGAAQTTAGANYPLDSIAAVVLGGTSLTGGKGNIFGTLVGVLIIGILSNGLIMLGIQQAYRDLATGAVLLFAVLLQNIKTSKST